MKKITLIASLLLVFAACQKADIRPRTGEGGCMDSSSTKVKNLSVETPNPDGSGTPNALSGNNGSGTDSNPNSPDPNGGDITDPLRKKDQKDNK